MKKKNFGIMLSVIILLAALTVSSYTLASENKNIRYEKVQGDWKGTITVIKTGLAAIHSYMAPEDSGMVTTQIIESKNKLVVIDAQFFRPYAKELKSYIKTLKKPVDRILITHSHPDHWLGLEIFSDYPIYTFPEIHQEIDKAGDFIIKENKPALGELIADAKIVPNHTLKEGMTVIDGLQYEFQKVLKAESTIHLMIRLPEINTLIAQDLLYNNVHLFIGQREFDGWIRAVKEMSKIKGIDIILTGHGEPADSAVFDKVIGYIETAKKVYQSASTGEELKSKLIKKYPNYRAPVLLDLSNRVLGLIDTNKQAQKIATIYELAINKVKKGRSDDFKNAREKFITEMKKEEGVGVDGAWQSFFTTAPDIDAKDVLVGMTKWDSMGAFGKAAEHLMPMQVTKNYFDTFDSLVYLQLQPENGKSFDLNSLLKDGQVVEFAVRITKEAKKDVFAEKRKTFFDILAGYKGFVFDREFVAVDGSVRAVIIVWESLEDFKTAGKTIFQLPEYKDFVSIVDVKAYQAAQVVK